METNFCSKCGTQMRGMNSCPSCGMTIEQMDKKIKKKPDVGYIVTVIVVALYIGMFLSIVIPGSRRASNQAKFTQCQSNMKNIGAALKMYSTDNAGYYPDRLEKLIPDYLKVIPTCAAARKDTYSTSYKSHCAVDEHDQDRYTFLCEGYNHKAVGVTAAGYPQYNSTEGLKERP